jgi:hypothetical protein
MPVLCRVLVAGLAAAALAAPARGGEPYKDAAHKFALVLPDGWEVVPDKELAAFNADNRQDNPRDRYVRIALFRPAGQGGSPGNWKYPMASVVTIPFKEPDATFQDFEKVLTRVFTRRNPNGRSNLRVPLAFDEQRKRLIVQWDIDDGRLAEYSGGYIGKEEVVVVSGLVERKAYRDHVPTFEKFVDSFRFDDDPAGKPAEPPYLDKLLKTNLGPTGQMAVVGLGVAAVVLLVGMVVLKEKRN